MTCNDVKTGVCFCIRGLDGQVKCLIKDFDEVSRVYICDYELYGKVTTFGTCQLTDSEHLSICINISTMALRAQVRLKDLIVSTIPSLNFY
jgi:hypothetical protein